MPYSYSPEAWAKDLWEVASPSSGGCGEERKTQGGGAGLS